MKTTETLGNQTGAGTAAAHLEVHEVAKLFPWMTRAQSKLLVEDLKKNGQRVPLWTYQGRIIDGRERYFALGCLRVPPKVQEWDGNGSLVEFVFAVNKRKKRHLTRSQRAAVAVDAMDMLEAEAAERRRRDGAAGGRRGPQSKTRQQKTGTPGTAQSSGFEVDLAAFLAGVNPQHVADAKTLKAESPDFFEAVRWGTWNIACAMGKLRERQAYYASGERAPAEGFPPIERQVVAWHEAGHAVVAYVLGKEVVSVTIESQPECVWHPDPKLADRAQGIRAAILVSLAGEEAQVRWGGEKVRLSPRLYTSTDLNAVRKLQPREVATDPTIRDGEGGEGGLVTWSAKTRQLHVECMRSRTRDILSSPRVWMAVQAVVAALLQKKTLDGAEVHAIIGRHTGKMASWQW